MSQAVAAPPSLESGDHMSREEFHRRYEQRPDLRRAELIEGVVYLASPMRYSLHDRPAAFMGVLLGTYAIRHRGVEYGDAASLLLDGENEFQADGFLFRRDSGRLRERPDGYLKGAPELVVEVAASTVSRDLHEKMRAYERNGVLEYIVWRTEDAAIDWFALSDGHFVRRQPGADGIIDSTVFPGFRLDIPKLLDGDEAGALAALR